MQHSPKDFRNKILGRKGEDAACRYLKKHGYQILKRNYATPFGEADVVARKDGTYCFVEVKARESDAYGLPAEAVDRAKRQRYLCAYLKEEVPVRFDVASVFEGGIEYFEGAFV